MKLFSAPDKVAIFVSYRRADSAGYAGRLVDKLKAQFGNQVFFDVDSIRPGANFHDVIRETFDKCGDGASMPAEAVLPARFQEISSLNAMELRHMSFDRDVQAVSDHLADILGGAKATTIERALLKLYGPLLGASFARIYGGIVLFSAMGAIWALLELAATALTMIQGGLRSILSPSFLDPEMLRLQAIWTAALGALLCGFIGRRSIRWWRHATVTMWVGLLELILAVGIAFVYVTQVPEASVVDLFEMKRAAGSR